MPHFNAAGLSLHASTHGQRSVLPPQTRLLPRSLGAWKLLLVAAGLSAGKRVVMSEGDVLWDPGAPLLAIRHGTADYAGMLNTRWPLDVYNAGFFLTQGPAARRFFVCVLGRWLRRPSDLLAEDQTFLNAHLRRHALSDQCEPLRHVTLQPEAYSCCRRWRLKNRSTTRIEVAHATFCQRLAGAALAREDECKRRLLSRFHAEPFALSRLRRRLGGRDGGALVDDC